MIKSSKNLVISKKNQKNDFLDEELHDSFKICFFEYVCFNF